MAINVSKLVRSKANNINVDWPTLSRSPEFERYLTSLMDSVSMRGNQHRLRLQLDRNPRGEIAYTNGDRIYLNLENDLQKQMSSLENRFKVILGILFHELGHIRFTDFDRSNELIDQVGKGKFPVGRPDGPKQDVDELEAAMSDPRTRAFFQKRYAELQNYAIDAHDEECLIADYSVGGRTSLIEQAIIRTRMCLEAMSTTVDQVLERADQTGNYLTLLCVMIFQYIRFGEIIVKDERVKDHPVVQMLPAFMEDADIAAHTDDTDERFMAINRIMVKLWPFIREIINQAKQMAQQMQKQQGEGSQSQSQQGSSSQGQGSSQGKSDSSSQSQSGDGEGEPGEGDSQGQGGDNSRPQSGSPQGQQGGQSSQQQGDPSSSQQGQTDGKDAPVSADDVASALNELTKAFSDAENSVKQTKTPENRAGSGERSKSSSGKDDSTSSGKAGEDGSDSSETGEDGSETSQNRGDDSTSPKSGDEGSDESSEGEGQDQGGSGKKEIPSKKAEDAKKEADESDDDAEAIQNALRALVKAIQEQKAADKVDQEMGDDIREAIRNTDAGSTHEGVPIQTEFADAPSPADQQRYQTRLSQVKSYSTRIQRTLKQELEMFSKGYTQRYRPFGKGLDARDAYRPDQQFFTNKKLPQDIPEMAVAVLVDLSGSTEGNRNKASVDMAILVEDFCRGMRIPVMVAGHTLSPRGGISYQIFSKFDETSSANRAKIVNMVPDVYGNRDGLAIAVTQNLLNQRPEEIKLMFIISDGLPYAMGYSGKPACEDIRRIVKGAQKDGIEVFAAAIGDDKEAIENIYGNSFLDITDLSKLPKTLVTLIKKRIQKNIR